MSLETANGQKSRISKEEKPEKNPTKKENKKRNNGGNRNITAYGT